MTGSNERSDAAAHRGAETPVGYGAAMQGAALIARPDRRLLRVGGRAPSRMLAGLFSGSLPPEHLALEGGLLRGRAPYSAFLTPKGRIVSDLRLHRLEGGEGGALLLQLPVAGAEAAIDRMRKSLPPRFARIEELTPPLAIRTLVGPRAAALLGELSPQGLEPALLEEMREGEELLLPADGALPLRITRGGDTLPPGFDLIGSAGALALLAEAIVARGGIEASPELGDLLRIEKGRPAWGADFDEDTLPPEAGIENRAIDHRKGCYTGQEVIVRIRDRGKVNRRLRGLLLANGSLPEPGAPLFLPEREGPVGELRSRAHSPRFGRGIAFAYLRREVEPLQSVRVGDPTGPSAEVRALDDEGWVLVEGEPGSVA